MLVTPVVILTEKPWNVSNAILLSQRRSKDKVSKERKIQYNSQKENIVNLAVVILGTILLGFTMTRIHIYLPNIFPEPASFPYLDAFTTVMSFVAYILLARRKIESWYLWILVDIIGIGLYYAKDVLLLSILYLTFLVIATKGLFDWRKSYKSESSKAWKQVW